MSNISEGRRREVLSLPSTPAPSIVPDAEPVKGPAKFVRKPFGSRGQKLARPNRTGYVRRWFNDTPGRIIQAQEAGWTHVLDNTGKNETISVGVTDSGAVLMAYLMETPKEWYDEDMAVQQREVDKVDEAIHRGAIQGTVGQDGRYIPSRGIKIATQ